MAPCTKPVFKLEAPRSGDIVVSPVFSAVHIASADQFDHEGRGSRRVDR